MRVVFTAQTIYSHLVPTVLPIAALTQRAGHEVVVATGAELAHHVERAGLRPLVLPNAISMADILGDEELARKSGARLRPGVTTAGTPEMFGHAFITLMGSRAAADLVEALSSWRPDVVVRETTEYGGYLAAEYLGVPHATLDVIAPLAPYGHPVVLAELNRQRAAWRLPPVVDPLAPLRGFRASVVPEAFHPDELRLQSGRHYRPPETETETLDPAVAELPADRPLVLASLGSIAGWMLGNGPSPLDTIIEVLGQMPVTGVVALGAERDPAEWQGARASNVHLMSFVQQSTLLAATDVFITHCGFNGTREAFSSGVPMVGLPLFAEQPANAERIEQLGAGLALRLEDLSIDSLTSTVERVLTEPVFRARAKGIQRRMLALPPAEHLVADIEEFVNSSAARLSGKQTVLRPALADPDREAGELASVRERG
ncbi:glycosyltransferase [Streptomyces sp. NBC_01750]|uniref:glycosyltransferase n=1 Tax=Streptomyces sp. NBC_01750 TaxID=2975928 RepID=UPI002DDAFD45|nr:glycosyltransferase [Streptomyces sp. NBC_01750]WSD36823.1 glycosyltransferase [Streptomyces sp. NBC_01750]